MTMFHFILIVTTIIGSIIGYRIASNDLLQHNFLGRRLSGRLTELICSLILLIPIWALSSPFYIAFIPLIVIGLFIGIKLAIKRWLKLPKSLLSTEDYRKEYREAAFRTGISVTASIACALLACRLLPAVSNLKSYFGISSIDIMLCHGLLLAVLTLLVILLSKYVADILNDTDGIENHNRSRLILRKMHRDFPRI